MDVYILEYVLKIDFPIVVAGDGSKPLVSCLKIEPVVSIFPVL